ncbi:MAG: hypothetical protein WBF55_13530, partial [Syntrophobacteria bacterium]
SSSSIDSNGFIAHYQIPPMRLSDNSFPIPWREGIKGGLNLVHRLPMFVVARGGGSGGNWLQFIIVNH